MATGPGSFALCGALLLAACATKGGEMRVVVPQKKTYLDAEALDGGPVEAPPEVLAEVRPSAPEGIAAGDRAPWVVARFRIDAKGRISEIEITRAADERLAAPAREAISRWRLRPARRGGQGIAVVATVQLRFDRHGGQR